MTDFNTCATVLLLQQPFFGSLLMKYKHVEDRSIPTLGVSNAAIRYNPDFMTQMSEGEGVFCIAHEVMHGVYEHLPRMHHYRDSGVGPDGKPFDWHLYNIAADYPINDALRESKVGDYGPFLQKMGLCMDKKYPFSMTPEEIYCDLKKKQEEKGGGKPGQGKPGDGEGKPGPGEPGGPLDSHDCGQGGGEPEPQAITAADVIQAANLAKMTRGSLPAGVDRLIGEIQRPDVSPWKQLRHLVVTSLAGYDQSSWRRLNRRLIVRRIGVPGRIASGSGSIGIVVDTSGSIDAKMLALFGGHMGAIIADARPEKVLVYWTDGKVHRVDKIKTHTDLVNLLRKPVPGGGGTDMPKGVEAALADKCDSVVVLTDGYTPFGERSPKPVIWAITSPSIKAPHGKTVSISGGD